MDFIKDQAIVLTNQINESIQLANKSTKPDTKVSRLEFARAKLKDLQLLSAQCPAITITNLDDILATFARMDEEFSKAGYYALTEPSLYDYTPSVARQINNNSALAGWRFSATIQLGTPLRILKCHGRVVNAENGQPVETEMQHGIWVPVPKTFSEMGIPIPNLDWTSTCASDIGQVPEDGGEYMQFLKIVRLIVEANEEIPIRLERLRAELAKPAWADFILKLGGHDAIYNRFFPAFIETIPGLPAEAISAMWSAGLTTPRSIIQAADSSLLSIKGIGPARLKAILKACELAQDKNAEHLDMVQR